jgi:hypothetical protein
MKDLFSEVKEKEKLEEQMKLLLLQRTEVLSKDLAEKQKERFRGNFGVRRSPRR